jgi:hypothetical protein
MPFRALHEISRWFHASLTHRIKASALVLTLGMAVVIGAVSFVGMRVLLAEKITQEMESVADLFAQHVELHLEGIAADVRQLAGSSLLANALVDSQGREIYLTPHLREYRTGGKEPLVLCLHDFLGRVITCQGHSVPVDAEHAPWRERVLNNNVYACAPIGRSASATAVTRSCVSAASASCPTTWCISRARCACRRRCRNSVWKLKSDRRSISPISRLRR